MSEPDLDLLLSDFKLLRELLDCFTDHGNGLVWPYIEGPTISEALTPEIEARLKEIKPSVRN